MQFRHAAAAFTTSALLTMGRIALAADTPATQVGKPESPSEAAQEAPAQRQPLMELLNAGGLAKPLEDANINIYGYIEGSYIHNFDNPKNHLNFGRGFEFEDRDVLLNQLDLTFERTVDASNKKFDVGGRVEWIFGADAGFLHANGLFDWYDDPRDPENQFDLYQAYVDVAVPVGNGLLVRAGKMAAVLGYESTTPAQSPFYSHSYLFNFASPFTHTGIMGAYALNDSWTITAGISRGWDQSTEDNNGAIDFVGQVKWTISKQTSFTFAMTTGPELADNNGNYRTALDAYLVHNFTDKFSVAINGDFSWETGSGIDGDNACWGGVATYASYILNDYFTLNGRAEWFRDDAGTRLGVAANYYEFTTGVTIHPLAKDRFGQYLIVRPEFRVDVSNEPVFNDSDDDTMFTVALDVIYSF